MSKKIIAFLMSALLFSTARGQTDSTKADSLLLLQIQNQLQQSAPAPVRSPVSANPDISVIGDFRGGYQSNLRRKYNAELHEAEISLQSVVDPYARADFFVSFSPAPAFGSPVAEIEEGYLTTLSLPAHLQLKAGKFRQALGKINSIHPHALSFIDMPNAFVRFFGEDGLKDEGISLSWLVPNHAFFQELTVEITDGPNESPSFARSGENIYSRLAHLKNFWDLTSNATLELGLTAIAGVNSTQHTSEVFAADLTYKWKPVRFNTYKSFTFQNEFYYSRAKFYNTKVNALGWYSLMSVQVSKRWFASGRYDYTHLPSSDKFIEQAASATLGWYATEFQKIELEGKYTMTNNHDPSYYYPKKFSQIFLRWIFVIGTHGAHQY